MWKSTAPHKPSVIDLDDDIDVSGTPDENGDGIGPIFLHNESMRDTDPRLSTRAPAVISPECYVDIELLEVESKGQIYRPGKSAELLDGTFIRILSIVERNSLQGREVLLRGPRFKRCKCFSGLLPLKLNEVGMFMKKDDVSLSCISRLRILILTNSAFPMHNDVKGRTKEAVENEGKLVCRWDVTIPISSTTKFMSSGILRRLREDEADSSFRVSDRQLRYNWRGNTECTLTRGEGYTFGDAFCGGGGMGCGARAAGFINSWGFDHDLDACNTYSKNFPEAHVYSAPVDLFLTALAGKELQVDVVHLSPPCQPHSVAHTIPGKDDEKNEAAGLCITSCLEKTVPRFATFEQAFGLVYRHDWLRAAVSGFIAAGFSVEWDILHCVQYGVPQTRRRLFMIASCPGERLPPFPEPTYSFPTSSPDQLREHGLLPPRTLRDAIGHLDPDADQIDELLGGPHLRFSEPRPTSQLLDAPLMGTVKAGSGCYDVHPSFLRRFTVRELACIQTFPEHHQFAGIFGKQRRQVGNAVPPVMAEALLRQVKEALEESDVRTSLELANGAQNDLSRFPIIGLKLCMADSDDVEIVREVPASCPLSLCVVGKSLGSESTNNGDAPRGIHSDFAVRENGWYNNGSEYDDPIILD